MKLIIVESPSKAPTISKYLGSGYKIMASYGHINTISEKKNAINIQPNSLTVQYEAIDRTKDKIKALIESAKVAEMIYLCTDPDREGEAIAYHLQQLLLKNHVKAPMIRATFNEITEKAVKHAIANPIGDINMPLVYAQQSRQVLDRLIGIDFGSILYRYLPKSDTNWSCGRVQTPSLRLILDRDHEINNFKPEAYYEIYLKTSTSKNEPLTAQFFSTLNQTTKRVLVDKSEAEKIVKDCKGEKVSVLHVKKTAGYRKPPSPFTTSSLQQEAINKFGWKAEEVMQVAQNLYQKGFITYMRTDSISISQDFQIILKDFIDNNYPNLRFTKRTYTGKIANAQEAHEAIRPTDLNTTSISSYPKEEKLYKLIYNRTLASFLPDAEVENTTIDLACDNYVFRATGTVIQSLGYLTLYNDQEESDNDKILPKVKEGEVLNNEGLTLKECFTKPKARYTGATLVKKLESLGIGRPSTYATILAKLEDRDYIAYHGKAVQSTAKAESLVNVVMKLYPEGFDYNYTAKMEEHLDKISNNQENHYQFLYHFKEALDKIIQTKEKNNNVHYLNILEETCPKCNHPLGEKINKFGQKYIVCTNYRSKDDCCGYIKPRDIVPEQKSDTPCHGCNQLMSLKTSKKGTPYLQCKPCNLVRFFNPDGSLQELPTEYGKPCPKCHSPLHLRKGKFGNEFVICSKTNNSDCKFIGDLDLNPLNFKKKGKFKKGKGKKSFKPR